MKRNFAILVIALSLMGSAAWACSSRIQGGIDYKDIEIQEALTQDLAAEADLIALVEVVGVDHDQMKMRILTKDVFKGELGRETEISLHEGYDVFFGCEGSVTFHNVNVREGKDYLIYLEEGKLRRAVSMNRDHSTLSFKKELEIIRGTDNVEL